MKFCKSEEKKWWDDVVRKERGYIQGRKKDTVKERCVEVYKDEMRRVKMDKEQFGRKMNEGVNASRNLFWKEERSVTCIMLEVTD